MNDLQVKWFILDVLNGTSVKYGMLHWDWRFRNRRPGIPVRFHYPEVALPGRYEEAYAARTVNPDYYGRVTIVP